MAGEEDLEEFLRHSIRSVWALELVLLLRRTAPRAWKAEELVRELRASQAVVDDNLAVLEASGLVAHDPDGAWAFAPASRVLAELCETLQQRYRESPVKTINAIVSAGPDSVRQLAEAFRLRKERK